MPYPERHYHWQWNLQSSPEALWPLAANPNRFTQDAGGAPLAIHNDTRMPNARLHLRQRLKFGVSLDYIQEPYQWEYPHSYGFTRRFKTGPLAELRTQVQFTARPNGGTQVNYDVWVRARTLPGVFLIPIQIGTIYARKFERLFHRYDELIQNEQPLYIATGETEFEPGGRNRMAVIYQRLVAEGANPDLLDRLIDTIQQADPLALARLRPYALADSWGANRRDVLHLFLVATRYGLLDFRWDLLCPLCRGPQISSPTLGGIQPDVHCDVCNIDFQVNFEQSVELTFRPNPAIRAVAETDYCIGGPDQTPHIVVQQLLQPGEVHTANPTLETGRYRLRTLEQRGGQALVVTHDGATDIMLAASEYGWATNELVIASQPILHFENRTSKEQLFILERMAWSDQAATAAEVTLLQTFRDLFASEALRPGEQISVGKLAVLFTDLRNSTGLYREIGDAPAFGLVMDHFDILRDAVNAEDGAIVKTLGDSVMAVFRQPAAAIRAALRAQRALANPDINGQRPLQLKAGVHYGPCIAVTLNERLDYFGSTVNIAARLQTLSSGSDVIMSSDVCSDPEVNEWFCQPDSDITLQPVTATLKGFDQEHFDLWRIENG